jgi:phytoene dehydrogenase-like protein
MGGITRALQAAAEHHGAEVRLSAPVAEVRFGAGRAQGVTLADGTVIDAPLVLSNADPKRSLLTLLPDSALSADMRKRVAAIDMQGSMARIHLLVDELPAYVGFDGPAEGPQHRGHHCSGQRSRTSRSALRRYDAASFPRSS